MHVLPSSLPPFPPTTDRFQKIKIKRKENRQKHSWLKPDPWSTIPPSHEAQNSCGQYSSLVSDLIWHGTKMPYGWNQAARKLTEKSEWASCLSAWACLPVLVPEYPQNTPRDTELISFDRNRACTRLGLLVLQITIFLGVFMVVQFFKIAGLCCAEKLAEHKQAGLHSLEHLPVTDTSFSDCKVYKGIFVGLTLAKVTQDRHRAGSGGWSGSRTTTRELVLTMEKMLPRIPEQISSSFCCLRWRWIWWRTTGSRMRRDSGRENTKVKKPLREELAIFGCQWHCGMQLVSEKVGSWMQPSWKLTPSLM